MKLKTNPRYKTILGILNCLYTILFNVLSSNLLVSFKLFRSRTFFIAVPLKKNLCCQQDIPFPQVVYTQKMIQTERKTTKWLESERFAVVTIIGCRKESNYREVGLPGIQHRAWPTTFS